MPSAELEQLRKRLANMNHGEVGRNDYAAAIEGRRMPGALGLELQQLCTVRGIRYHDGFAVSLRGLSPIFTRALNARDIMSNRIPDRMSSEEEPYCIWHPDVASEETYRQLAKKFPSMRYQVGRACAVAGYTELYLELDLVPEVSIAEEAREASSNAILDHIMSSPVKYSIMNDYDGSIDVGRAINASPTYLNGDTAVRNLLDIKQAFYEPGDPDDFDLNLFGGPGFNERVFNITEDMNIDLCDVDGRTPTLLTDPAHNGSLVELLTGPLPPDLPTIDKDILVCMAAYHGEIDRYARLRRPKMCTAEIYCCVRGIYHNTMFAVWWSRQSMPEGWEGIMIRSAVNARLIMNNVLSLLTDGYGHSDLPYLIWYPSIAKESTYRALVHREPKTLPQVLRACIVAQYMELFDELAAELEAQTRKKEAGLDELSSSYQSWKVQSARQIQYSDNKIYRSARLAVSALGPLSNEWSGWATPGALYGGIGYDASSLQLMACLPEEWKIKADDQEDSKVLDYVQWPAKKWPARRSKDGPNNSA